MRPTPGRIVMARTDRGTWPGIVVMVESDLVVWVAAFTLEGCLDAEQLTHVSQNSGAIGWYWPPRVEG